MKAALLTPVYLSFSWVLTVSYQIFTDQAVKTVSAVLAGPLPEVANWLTTNIQTVSFIYAFSWIFVLSSVLPSLILGKERSVLVQYMVCLVLTFLALSATSLPYISARVESIVGFATVLSEPVIAALYLVVPYLFMVVVDMYSHSKRKRAKEEKQDLEKMRDFIASRTGETAP